MNVPIHSGIRAIVWLRGHTDDFSNGIVKACIEFEESNASFDYLIEEFSKFGGAYSIAVQDNKSKNIYLCADRLALETIYFSEKYRAQQWGFKIKDMLVPSDILELENSGVDEILLYRWLMESHTMFSGIKKLMPGQAVCISNDRDIKYIQKNILNYECNYLIQDQSKVIDDVSLALDKYFSRLRLKFPKVAVFLSGGVDSSLLLAKAKEHDFERLIAITCRFVDYDNPELDRAIAVAEHLQVEHHIVDISSNDILGLIPYIISKFESPFSYFNLFAREMMFRAIKNKVDAVLIGEGADGLFSIEVGGALSALRFQNKRRIALVFPFRIRHGLGLFFRKFRHSRTSKLADIFSKNTINYLRDQGRLFEPGKGGSKIHAEDIFLNLSKIRKTRKNNFYKDYEPHVSEEGMEYSEILKFTQNIGLYTNNRHQYFCYSRLAFEHGITPLLPFLSSDILPIGLSLHNCLREDALGSKPVLKKLACRYIPENIIYAAKMDFETPLMEWLERNEDKWRVLLSDQRTANRRIFDIGVLNNLQSRKDFHLILMVIAFETFMRQFMDK